jgi:hypothetical protein
MYKTGLIRMYKFRNWVKTSFNLLGHSSNKYVASDNLRILAPSIVAFIVSDQIRQTSTGYILGTSILISNM